MWQEFGKAFCLLLVLEGLLPFLYPRGWRDAVSGLGRLGDRSLRLIGLGSMLLGIVLLYCIH
ncbi:DUF2065 domain-containing protein [Pseudomonas nitroreducens]|uniref:DUF2065 domain-containing protein n=1 Tax=Pseudomonas TaxID=286 RepID=UPI00036A8B23|nr:DUF2065 family protein [Pseudomonas nitroreducens]